ncbi:hypothetical protein BC941DRAFT_502852 [Chlamydoabsidia padenii]|nr:hypothetical protein BC941DRAFT_502852 [Chlamydoabsidia padenii]
MKNIPPPNLNPSHFSKPAFEMGETPQPIETSQDPATFFFHASTSTSSFHSAPSQDSQKDLSSLYKTFPLTSNSTGSSSSGYNTPTHHSEPFDSFMSMMMVDHRLQQLTDPSEAGSEKKQTPIHAESSSRRSKGKSSLVTSPSSDDPEYNSDSDPYAILKRRRNTEASARFRVKKKMKEQALRRTADETTLRSQQLQRRVHELEKEIKWLRELIVEKKKKDDDHNP